jgi:ClpP class serine protease
MTQSDIDSKGRPIFRDVIDPNAFYGNRDKLIREIEKELDGAALITYTANLYNPGSAIMLQDAILFEDLLRSVADKKKGVLMLTSLGGDPNAAEKLMQMCRKRFVDGFQIIVPFYAKSAATLMCLGADKICMGYGAELGPIDPQIPAGGGRLIPARAFIDGFEDIRKKVKGGDPVSLYYPLMQQIKPEIIAICQTAIKDSKETAESWLKKYMLKSQPNQAEQVAQWLSEGQAYKSHGKPIDFEEAKNILKLNVDELSNASPLWQKIWELFTKSTVFLQNSGTAKLFESNSVSLSLSVNIMMVQQPPPPPPQQPPRQQPPPPPPQQPPR